MSMAKQQALLHRVVLTLGSVLRQCHGTTYISRKILELDARIRNGDKTLYSKIQENVYLPTVMDSFQEKLEDFSADDFWK